MRDKSARTDVTTTTSPAATSGEIDDVVTAVLTASRALVGVSARSLHEVEQTVTITQFRTLVVLSGHGPINLNHLAELLGVTSSTAMRMVDRLLVADLVSRQDNPENRREVLLDLTRSGRRVVRTVTERRRRDIARIVAAMPISQRSRLVSALRAFSRAAGEPETPNAEVAW